MDFLRTLRDIKARLTCNLKSLQKALRTERETEDFLIVASPCIL